MMDHACILPGEQAVEVWEIVAELERRHVEAWKLLALLNPDGTFDTFVFHISPEGLERLPKDKDDGDPYLGDDDSGHNLHHVSEGSLQLLEMNVPGATWLRIGPRG
jgi:hypothetical protein